MKITEDLMEAGEVSYQLCWCGDQLHRPGYRSAARVPGKPDMPHLIAVRVFEMAWRVE